jgi:lambda repressor-like predicted transcriptional regulator
MKTASTVPPLAQVAAALRKTTEVLAFEVTLPTDEPPLWTEFEWRIARAAAAMHGISSLLFAASRWVGPTIWRAFLGEQRKQTIGRHQQIAGLLDRIDSQARCEGVAFVALKGAALHAKGIYQAGYRPMGDIDLLIRSGDAAATARLLAACGYESAFAGSRHQVFQSRTRREPPHGRLGECVDDPIKIEVHTRIAEHLPMAAVDITDFLFPHELQPGLNEYRSAASLMMHLLLHAAGNIRARALRLIQLHDIALLAGRLTADDWTELGATRPGGCPLWWALPPFALTELYYPGALPPAVCERVGAECPRLLRSLASHQRLTDVSWSNIYIEAFPGVEWSRTVAEALEFMASRVWPSREARSELKESAAQIPDSSTVAWYAISHRARILRWIFSRPPRVQTLLSIRAALAQEA